MTPMGNIVEAGRSASRIGSMITPEDDHPDWVENKVSVAAADIRCVRNALVEMTRGLSRRNPVLMVGNPKRNPVLMVGNPADGDYMTHFNIHQIIGDTTDLRKIGNRIERFPDWAEHKLAVARASLQKVADWLEYQAKRKRNPDRYNPPKHFGGRSLFMPKTAGAKYSTLPAGWKGLPPRDQFKIYKDMKDRLSDVRHFRHAYNTMYESNIQKALHYLRSNLMVKVIDDYNLPIVEVLVDAMSLKNSVEYWAEGALRNRDRELHKKMKSNSKDLTYLIDKIREELEEYAKLKEALDRSEDNYRIDGSHSNYDQLNKNIRELVVFLVGIYRKHDIEIFESDIRASLSETMLAQDEARAAVEEAVDEALEAEDADEALEAEIMGKEIDLDLPFPREMVLDQDDLENQLQKLSAKELSAIAEKIGISVKPKWILVVDLAEAIWPNIQ